MHPGLRWWPVCVGQAGPGQWVRQSQWSGAGDGGFGTVGLAVPGCLVAAAKLGWVQALTVLPVLGTTTGDSSLVLGLG